MINARQLIYPGLAMLFNKHCEDNPSMDFRDTNTTRLYVSIDFERGITIATAVNAGRSVVVEYTDSDLVRADFDALYARFTNALEKTWPKHPAGGAT